MYSIAPTSADARREGGAVAKVGRRR